MHVGLKVLASLLLIGAQIAIIVAVRRARTSTLLRLGFYRYRGEEFSAYLRQAGEELRDYPGSVRGHVNFITALCTLPLDVIVIALWAV
jgi:hypothetical protein